MSSTTGPTVPDTAGPPSRSPTVTPLTAPTGAGADRSVPLRIPRTATLALDRLAAEVRTDSVAPLLLCAGVLLLRLLPAGTSARARVVRGGTDTAVSVADAPDLALGLRGALSTWAADRARPGAGTGPVVVTFRIGADDGVLDVETAPEPAAAPAADAWARAFVELLTGCAEQPDAPLLTRPLVSNRDRDRIVRGLASYRTPRTTYRTMAEPFEEQVARTPDAVALVDASGPTMTYRELDERSNRLAHVLRRHGAGAGTRVGICLERGIPQVVAVYAAVKAGATYVPVDAALPDDRIAWMLQDALPCVVVTDPACRDRIPGGGWDVLDADTDDAPAGAPTAEPAAGPDASALLHLLYTSGTTGRPKGVATPTAAALANLSWMQHRYPYGPGGTAVFKSSPGFDISIWELFWPLYHGARLVVCPPGAERDPRALARITEDFGVTTLFLVPTMLTPFLEALSPERAGALSWMLCGGEPMSPRLPQTFYARLPDCRLINAFGPTEAGPVTDNVLEPGTDGVPVGRPAENFRVTVLDQGLGLVPVGAPGEAYISGEVGLADGYWRAPARTAERFVADPYGPPGSRMYRTGDLCRARDDGHLEHLGRIDRQLKIRGLRVEPGEIESVLTDHPSVGDCVVVPLDEPLRLLAFVVPAAGRDVADVDHAAVVAHATSRLPAHMLPERVVPVPRLPATVNSKVDKDALVAVWEELVAAESAVEPPADDLEASVLQLYREVLGRTPIGMLDNFVQLGGHSMLAIQLLERCAQSLPAVPDVTELLVGTVRDVTAVVRARAASTEPVPPRPADPTGTDG